MTRRIDAIKLCLTDEFKRTQSAISDSPYANGVLLMTLHFEVNRIIKNCCKTSLTPLEDRILRIFLTDSYYLLCNQMRIKESEDFVSHVLKKGSVLRK
jgi:hypothetical protein